MKMKTKAALFFALSIVNVAPIQADDSFLINEVNTEHVNLGIIQDGDLNNLNILLRNASYTQLNIEQYGAGNAIYGLRDDEFVVDGQNNVVNIFQHGSNNVVQGNIIGGHNSVYVSQYGYGNKAVINQY